MQKVSDIRKAFLEKLEKKEFVIDKSGVQTVEIVGAHFLADEDLIFGARNDDYIARELAWYQSQSLNVNDIPAPVPKIWQQVATPDGRINSNYGYLVFSKENGDQYEHALNALVKDPFSRRAIMIYTRPSIQTEYNRDGMSDFICTNAHQYFIRDGKLVAHVTMRSNDAVFGYKNDVAWARYVQNRLVEDYRKRTGAFMTPGDLIWTVGSLHVYERHFSFVK